MGESEGDIMELCLLKGLKVSLGSLSGNLSGFGILNTSDGDIEVSCHAFAIVPLIIANTGGALLYNLSSLHSLTASVAASPVSL